MFKIGDFLIYKSDLCELKDIKKNETMNFDYYILAPVKDKSLTVSIPVDNKSGFLREVITKQQVEEIIKKIPEISLIENEDRMIEREYKILLSTDDHLDLIKIIKTTFARNEERRIAGKKIGDKDINYFKKAEQILYNEFSVALGLSYEDTKKYVSEKVEAAVKK